MITKSFKKYHNYMLIERMLCEMPELFPTLDKKSTDSMRESYLKSPNLTNKAFDTSIGSVYVDNIKLHKSNISIYYHKHDSGVIGTISHIVNNVQKFIHKGTDTQDMVHDLMCHHIHNSGELSTDGVNSVGAKHLWKSFIKKSPLNVAFSYNENVLTGKNIDDEEHNIWRTDGTGNSNRILAKSTR